MSYGELDRSGFRRYVRPDDLPEDLKLKPKKNNLNECREQMTLQIQNILKNDQTNFPPEFKVHTLLQNKKIFKLYNDFIETVNDYFENSGRKCQNKSINYRNRGNVAYGTKHLSQAVYLYTMAIVFAPDVPETSSKKSKGTEKKHPEELCLAYGNRSAVFFELEQYNATLVDITRALATGYPESKLPKLLLRQIECLVAQERLPEAKLVWTQLESLGIVDNDRFITMRYQLLYIDPEPISPMTSDVYSCSANPVPSVVRALKSTYQFDPSPELTPFSSKLKVKYSERVGRHVVTEKDIMAGEILVVEKPYSSVLLSSFELLYCHHCHRRLEIDLAPNDKNLSEVPCTSCTRVLYCSLGCRTQSWDSYHGFECSILPILYQCGIGHLAVRMLFVTPPAVASKVMNESQESLEDRRKKPVIRNSSDKVNLYENVFRLASHESSAEPDDSLIIKINSGLFLTLVCKVGEYEKELAGEEIVNHLYRLMVNSHSISHYISEQGQPGSPCGTFRDGRIATGLYPYISLLNHACQPNVIPTFMAGSLFVLRAMKNIPAGEEVLGCYGVHFAQFHYLERKRLLLDQYNFFCTCASCVIEGTNLVDEHSFYVIDCLQCGSMLHDNYPSLSRCYKCTDVFRINCTYSMDSTAMKQLYFKIDNHLGMAQRYIDDSRKSKDMNLILDALEMSERELKDISKEGVRDFVKLGSLYDELARSHFEIGNIHRARILSFRSACITETCYGPTSIENCPEVVKCADLFHLELELDDEKKETKVMVPWNYLHILKKAIRLLNSFIIHLPEKNYLFEDDSCYFVAEHRRLKERYERVMKMIESKQVDCEKEQFVE